jgi:predicted RNA-binding Zn-ribbon protein involved in translation (DUF1610 family)
MLNMFALAELLSFLLMGALILGVVLRLLRWRRERWWDEERRCPSCGYDLRASSDRCPECGQQFLRDEEGHPYHHVHTIEGEILPVEEPADPEALVRIYRSGSPAQIAFIRQHLEAAGIPAGSEGEPVVVPFRGPLHVTTRAADAARARQVIEELHAGESITAT